MAKTKVKYLRDAKGRYAGSVGQGRSLTQSVRKAKNIEAEKLRVRGELDAEQRRRLAKVLALRKAAQAGSTSSAPPSAPTPTGKRKGKAPLTPEENAIKLLADAQKAANKRVKVGNKERKAIYKDASKDRKLKNAANRLANNKGKPGDTEMLKEAGIFDHRAFLASTVKGKKKSNADSRIPPDFNNLNFNGDRVAIWAGTDHSKPREGFRIKKQKQEYSVITQDGDKLVLNNVPQVAYYKGEKIRGVPSTNQYLRQIPNEKLMSELATQMKYTESWDKKGVPAPAPYWDSNRFGSVPDKYKPERGYGNMELHHVSQWYKHDVVKMRADLESGKITPEEAKRLMRENLRENPNHQKGYEIASAPQSQREYIVLAAGVHNFSDGRKLYRENHPMGLHPDTLEVTEFGLADKNKGSRFGEIDGRQYHDTVRDGFWSEYSRRQALVLTGELNRRISKGEITKEQAKDMWTTLSQGGKLRVDGGDTQ